MAGINTISVPSPSSTKRALSAASLSLAGRASRIILPITSNTARTIALFTTLITADVYSSSFSSETSFAIFFLLLGRTQGRSHHLQALPTTANRPDDTYLCIGRYNFSHV